MEALCERLLDDARKRIEPTKAQRSQALASRNHLCDLLYDARIGRRILDDFMSGSFARNTAIRPVDDVDLVFVIDPSGWKVPFLGDKPDPAKLLDSFLGVVRRRYPQSSLRRQRRSIGLSLSHIHIDVLPAVAGAGDTIWIPDRKASDWLQSSPKTHAAHATAMNKACGNRGKAMIKLLKQWNAQAPTTVDLKSFLVETLAVRVLVAEHPTTLVRGLLCFWDNVVALAGGERAFDWRARPQNVSTSFFLGRLQVPDAAGNNIAEDVSRATFEGFAKRARIARDHLAAALNARKIANAREHVAHLF